MLFKFYQPILAVFAFCMISQMASAQYNTVFQDTFTDSLKYRDLTQKMTFGTFAQPTSGFRRLTKSDQSGLSFSSISQTDSARKYAGYINPNSTKASLAFDYRFPEIDRANDSVMVEFDVLWDQLVSGGNQGRIVVALMHNLPENIPIGTITDSFAGISPFGRPAYSFRILNRIPQGVNNYANMMYGGGRDSLGEFEKYSSGNNRWWLPGFISGPGGISPESNNPVYPLGPVNRWTGYTIASSSQWRHFTWKIFPEKLEVWTRSSALPAGNDTLVLRMVTPKPGPLAEMLSKMQLGHNLSALPDSLPTLYHWFPKLNGIRFYLNGQNPTYFANVSLKTSYVFTGVGNLTAGRKEICLYPNPGAESLKILSKEPFERIRIFDRLGKGILEESGSWSNLELSTSHLRSGIYFVEVQSAGKRTVQKWSKL
jgi:hypothetical protein